MAKTGMGHTGCTSLSEDLLLELDRSFLREPIGFSVAEFTAICWGRGKREWVV